MKTKLIVNGLSRMTYMKLPVQMHYNIYDNRTRMRPTCILRALGRQVVVCVEVKI